MSANLNKKQKAAIMAVGKQQLADIIRMALQEKMQLKRLQYTVPDVGQVVEELEMKTIKQPEEKLNAIHKVSVNGQLVRVMDVIENRIIQNDPQYEPWKFLRMNIKEMFDKMRKAIQS
ncbi:uncharacterized protein LOC113791327 [Dermatophagoides pteronyssinus]|uniref:Uncharacterized protein LOC113791327 n=1 Tax=Dermatophagoides pteronyssinus TaxID=6956 RepID=A0A6P6XTY6_DERPT|nr:uncharacterized protein LOC113791327 [Dermatophagoides pteronyssinus]